MSIVDLEKFGELSKKHNVISVIDSTFGSPYNQNPLKYGVSVVIHSATKYLGGYVFPPNNDFVVT